MGSYLYKVASKPFMLFEGRPVFKSTYAYKPYRSAWDAEKINKRLDFQTGVISTLRWWAKKSDEERRNVLVEHHGRIFELPYCSGAVIDDIAFNRIPVHTIPTLVNA